MQVKGEGKPVLRRFLSLPHFADVKMVMAVSADVDLENRTDVIWGVFTRFDPARDAFFERMEFDGAKPVYAGRLCIDATWKTGYPEPIVMDEQVVKKVDEKWDQYWKKT
jgi:4-hydroxy-3-polyprenylbenzoate decarboxylase